MNVYLVQHGLALPEHEDPARGLSPAGLDEVERVGRWAAAAGVAPRQIRHSGKLRAQQTAECLARHLDPPRGCIAVEGLAPNADVQPIARGDLDGVMLVGHLPFMSRLAAALVGTPPGHDPVHFRNAGIVCLGRADETWAVEWAVTPGVVVSSSTTG